MTNSHTSLRQRPVNENNPSAKQPARLTPQNDTVVLPLPPSSAFSEREDMALYARFMQHLQNVPNSRMEIKIFSAIQFTADMLDYSDAHVAKLLVDLGLRAPRMAFPSSFLKFADQSLMRKDWEVGGPSIGLQDLKRHWDNIGEDKFAFVNGDYSLIDEGAYF